MGSGCRSVGAIPHERRAKSGNHEAGLRGHHPKLYIIMDETAGGGDYAVRCARSVESTQGPWSVTRSSEQGEDPYQSGFHFGSRVGVDSRKGSKPHVRNPTGKKRREKT